MNSTVTPEQQAALQHYGVTLHDFIFYEGRRLDGQYLTQAVAVLVFYDFCLTFAEEVEYVWKTKPRISIAKALWFLNRYWPLVSVFVRVYATSYMFPTSLACNFGIQFTAWSGMFNIAIVDILLMLRVWALYNGSKRIAWILVGIFCVGMPAAIAIRKVPPLPSIPLVVPAPQSLTICKRSPPSELFSLYTMALAIDTVIFAMLVVKAWGKDMRGQMPVLATLIRDGALYYAAITLVLAFMIAATMIPLIYQPVADANLNIPLCSVACNRLILSLRGVYFKKMGGGDGTITTAQEPGRPQFASHTTRDIPLDSIQVYSPKSTIPFKSYNDDNEWDWDPESRSPTSTHVRSASRRLSRDRVTFEPSLVRSPSATRSAESPIFARVTVTKTKVVVGDDGKEYGVPAEPVERAVKSQDKERTNASDWWDSYESVGTEPKKDVSEASKPRVYETRIGYHSNRISEEDEAWYDDLRSPGKAV